MSSPDHDPKRAASEVGGAPVGTDPSDAEVINVRRGMFGVRGTGDTSGYGRLVREVTLAGRQPAALRRILRRASSTGWPRR